MYVWAGPPLINPLYKPSQRATRVEEGVAKSKIAVLYMYLIRCTVKRKIGIKRYEAS